MKILEQNKKIIKIEITPLELELLSKSVGHENSRSTRNWIALKGTNIDELSYHLTCKDITQEMKKVLNQATEKQRCYR